MLISSRAISAEGEIPKTLKGILLYAPYPKYPVGVVRQHVRGQGLFRLTFDQKTGHVTEVKVLQSTGHVILNELAAKALLQWRVSPGTLTSLRVPVDFQLGGAFVRTVH
jgi:TonB family protein